MTESANKITIDEATNAVDFLEKAALFLKQVPDDPMYWKWVIISLHAALYGIGVCSITLTGRKDVIRITKNGKECLLSFDEIMKMCQDPGMMTSVVSIGGNWVLKVPHIPTIPSVRTPFVTPRHTTPFISLGESLA
jgi:hypothetical protein